MSHLELLPSKLKQPIVEQTIDQNRIHEFLSSVVISDRVHANWLNTLSLLEHIGSRKILMSQSGINISEMVLKHASEEARHALFFKKLANRVSKSPIDNFESTNLIAGASAVIYFQRLDAIVWKKLSDSMISDENLSFVSYLYVTKIIEERAVMIYEIYDRILEEKKIGFGLKGILKEEEGHMQEMDECLKKIDNHYDLHWNELLEKEKKLFSKFFTQLIAKVSPMNSPE